VRSGVQGFACWAPIFNGRSVLSVSTDPGDSAPAVRAGSRPDDPERLASDSAVEAVSDLEIALARAEELAGDRAVSIFGAHVARQVLALGRLDEIIVQIVPIVLGDGVRLFGQPPSSRVRLERTYVGTSGMLTDIRFRVAGPPTGG
jgi:riboflavin biosynthesis pyrimidine reductase